MIRVVIADDQKPVRDGMTMLLSAEPDILVVDQAEDGTEAVTMFHAWSRTTTATTSPGMAAWPIASLRRGTNAPAKARKPTVRVTTPGPSVPRRTKASPMIPWVMLTYTQGRKAEMMSIIPPLAIAPLPGWNTPQPVAFPARIRTAMPARPFGISCDAIVRMHPS